LIVFVVIFCVDCNATVLYVRFTSNEIVIATDSKRTATTGETVCVCKISQIGDTFVAEAGLVSVDDSEMMELQQRGVGEYREGAAVVELGGSDVADAPHMITETAIRGFYRYYREVMGI
jgi:hypothetical protein